MKRIRYGAGAVLAMLAIIAAATPAAAQVMKQVPKDAAVVVKVNNLQQTAEKLKDMSQKLGLGDVNPVIADPLGFLKEQAKIKAGLKEDGEAALVIFRPAGFGPPGMIGLIPVSDYKAFIANWGEPAKEGDLDVVSTPLQMPLYAMRWGDYAAVTPSKELLGKERGLDIAPAVSRVLAERDLSVFINLKELRPLVLPQLAKIRDMIANMQPPQGNANQVAFQQAMIRQVFAIYEKFFRETDSAIFAANLAKGGLVGTMMAEFAPDSGLAKMLQGDKNTDADLLRGLPDGKYMVLGGWSQGGRGLSAFIEEFYAPALKALPMPEADAQKLSQALEAMKTQLGTMTGGAFGMLLPTADQVKESGAIHGLGVIWGDAKTMLEAQRKANEAQEIIQKVSSGGLEVKVSVKPDARSIDGVSLDQTSIEFGPPGDQPMAQQQAKLIRMLMGGKMISESGVVSDKAMISAVNVSDQQVQGLIAAVRQGLSPGSNLEAIKAASTDLPKQRVAEVYIYGGQIAQLVAAVSEQNAPEALANMPPIGITVGVDGNAVRIDAQVPTEMIKSLVDLGKSMGGRMAPRPGRRPRGQL